MEIFQLLITLLIYAVIYIATTYPYYVMYQKAGLKNPKTAFIPIIGIFKVYNLVNLSAWIIVPLTLVAFIPFIGILIVWGFSLYLQIKLCHNFGLSTGMGILSIFFGLFVHMYIAFSSDVQFVGQINPKYQGYDFNSYKTY